MLISCGGEASSSTSTSTSTPSTPTPSIDTGKTGNTSSSKEEDVIGVKGQEGALYASVDLMGMDSKMIDLAAPFDLSYRTVNGKFGSGENADAQIVVKDATSIHKEKNGKDDAEASPLHALNSVFSLLQLVSSMGIGGIDLSSIPYISDLQMNAANFYGDKFDESNSYGQMNIDYKDGQNVYYYAEVTPKDETGALKMMRKL